MSHGNITSWDDMEKVWAYTLKELSSSASQHPILISEPIENPIVNKEKTAEAFFEGMGAPALFFQAQPILSLYAQGITTGFVLDCGDGVTQ